jgi:hypothetical protein
LDNALGTNGTCEKSGPSQGMAFAIYTGGCLKMKYPESGIRLDSVIVKVNRTMFDKREEETLNPKTQ